MNRMRVFSAIPKTRFFVGLALAGIAMLFSASGAKAGCADPLHTGPSALALYTHPQDSKNAAEPFTIVGLWHLVYTNSADGSVFIQSFKTWHADGTEFENAFLPPTGGNICFGVWKQLGPGKVKLHHIGLMFDASGAIANTFTVDETDTVALDGKSYSGNFDFKLYDATGNIFTGVEVKGTTAGTRITVD
jgi:hypothetical protein